MEIEFKIKLIPEEVIAALSGKDFDSFRVKLRSVADEYNRGMDKTNMPVTKRKYTPRKPKDKTTPVSGFQPITSHQSPITNHPLRGKPAHTSISKECPNCHNNYKPTGNAQVRCPDCGAAKKSPKKNSASGSVSSSSLVPGHTSLSSQPSKRHYTKRQPKQSQPSQHSNTSISFKQIKAERLKQAEEDKLLQQFREHPKLDLKKKNEIFPKETVII